METPFGKEKDREFMHQAIKLANKAYQEDEVPIGAIVVDKDGLIIGTGYNQTEQNFTQAAHAESLAITAAGKSIKDWRLNGCWLYVTLEPCAMCMNLALLARLDGVAFGADSPLFGFRLDNISSFQLYQEGAISIVPGIRSNEAAELLKKFFRNKRKGDVK